MLRNFSLKNGILLEDNIIFLSVWLLVLIWKINRLSEAHEKSVDSFFEENFFECNFTSNIFIQPGKKKTRKTIQKSFRGALRCGKTFDQKCQKVETG